MLIHLDKSAVDAVFAGDQRESALKAVENLLRAHDQRKHFVSLDASAVRLRDVGLSRWAHGALEALLSSRKETGRLRNALRIYVEVGAGPGFEGALEQRVGRHVFRESVFHFEDYERTVRAVLVAEDATDAKIYAALGQAALFVRHEQRSKLALEPRGGGGSSLADAYQEGIEAKRITLAIADSDREIPGGAVGGTARALRNKVSVRNGGLFDLGQPTQNMTPRVGEECPLAYALVLHARMLENVIPLCIYEQALPPEKPEKLRTLCQRSPSAQWLEHVYLKEGLTFRDVERKQAHELAFWRSACAALGWDGCKQASACGEQEACRCEVVPALEHRAAELVLEWMTDRGRGRPIERLARLWGLAAASTTPASDELRELADWIMSWGFAPASAKAST